MSSPNAARDISLVSCIRQDSRTSWRRDVRYRFHEASVLASASRVWLCGAGGTNNHQLEHKYVSWSCPSGKRYPVLRGQPHSAWTSPYSDKTQQFILQISPTTTLRLLSRRETHTPSARALSYPEYSSGWQDPCSGVHGSSPEHPWRPGREYSGSRWRAGSGRLRPDACCHGLYHQMDQGWDPVPTKAEEVYMVTSESPQGVSNLMQYQPICPAII